MVMDEFTSQLTQGVTRLCLILIITMVVVAIIRLSWQLIITLYRSRLHLAKLDDAEGVILGKYGRLRLFSPTKAESHIAVLGSSGSGKTTCIGIPTLRRWRGNFFAIDISGDITDALISTVPAIIYSPLETHRLATTCYDPFFEIDKIDNKNDRDIALCNIAHYLIRETPGKHDAGAWYDARGRDILKAALLAFYDNGDDFGTIAKKVVNNDYTTLFQMIDDCANPDASAYLNKFQELRPQDIGGCFESAMSALLPFANPMLDSWIGRSSETSRPSFGPSTLEEYNIIFKLPDHLREQFAPLMELIVNQLFAYFSARDLTAKKKILFFLDEFASFPNIDIAPALQKFRKRGVRIMLLFQSLAQLDRNYGQSTRQEIMDNVGITAICKLENVETQEYFSRKAGSKVISKVSRSSSGATTTTTDRDRAIYPETFARLRKSLIIFSGGRYIFALKAFDFQENHETDSNQGIMWDEDGRPHLVTLTRYNPSIK